MNKKHLLLVIISTFCQFSLAQQNTSSIGPLEKVCGYRSTIKILFCPFIKLNNG